MSARIVTDAVRDEINGAEIWQMRAWVEDLLPEVDRLRAENAALRELIARFYTQTWQDPLTAEQSTLLDSIVQEADRG